MFFIRSLDLEVTGSWMKMHFPRVLDLINGVIIRDKINESLDEVHVKRTTLHGAM